MAAPIFKSPGGKTKMLKHLLPLVPEKINTYIEPFVGGGALFFALEEQGRFKEAVLADTSPFIISTYDAVREYTGEVDGFLERLICNGNVDPEGTYYAVRDAINSPCESEGLKAARFLYLSKNCFNGLLRTNKKGHFNVSWGKFDPPRRPPREALFAAAEALKNNVDLFQGDYPLSNADKPGDLIFADPPYIPLSKSSSFVDYTPGGFDMEKQRQLAIQLTELAHEGVHVIATNSDTPETRALYSDPVFSIKEVGMTRTINIDPSKRGKVNELIIYSTGARCE